jgi:hypothetical protein
MKNFFFIVLLTTLFVDHASSKDSAECFDSLPGEIDIRFDKPNSVKITKIAITARQDNAFIATEYLGSENLQASVYLMKNKQFCFAGDLGPVVDFKARPKIKNKGYYALEVESKSGPYKFYRVFRYTSGKYVLSQCHAQALGSKLRPCTENETYP